MIGVIVDGAGDFAALRGKFGNELKVLKTDGPRGHTVAPARIIGSARKQIGILAASGCQKAVILVDTEQRLGGYASFIAELDREIEARTFEIPVYAAAPNTMIENWYLADVVGICKRKFMRSKLKQKQYEGTHGKNELKALFQNGIVYNEVIHGPQLLRTVRFTVGRRNSRSLERFAVLIGK